LVCSACHDETVSIFHLAVAIPVVVTITYLALKWAV
jgi:hypothetical protein